MPEDQIDEFEPGLHRTVYLADEGVLGIVVTEGAYFSMVQYYVKGVSYEVAVDNEDIY